MLWPFHLCNCSVVEGLMQQPEPNVTTVVICPLDSLKLLMMKFLYFNYLFYKLICWDV